MRKIEKEEERLTFSEPDKQCYHLCIVNLVIGTLYCAKVGRPVCVCVWVGVCVGGCVCVT